MRHINFSIRRMRVFIIIYILMGLILILFLTYQIGRQTLNRQTVLPITYSSIPNVVSKPTVTLRNTPTLIVTPFFSAHLSKFSSKLGFSFEYPSEWGEATEQIIEASEDHPHIIGKRYKLTFSSTAKVTGTGFSSDFSQPTGAGDGFYKGDITNSEQVYATVFTWASVCPSFSASLYYGWINFNLPEQEISGVRLLLPLLSKSDIEKLNPRIPVNSTKSETGQGYCQPPMSAEQFFSNIKEKPLDAESLQNIAIFKDIIESSRVVQ